LGKELCANHFAMRRVQRGMWHISFKAQWSIAGENSCGARGTPVSVSNVLLTVENTDSACAALTNHLRRFLATVGCLHGGQLESRSEDYVCPLSERDIDNPACEFPTSMISSAWCAVRRRRVLREPAHRQLHGTDTVLAMRLLMITTGPVWKDWRTPFRRVSTAS